MSATLDSDLFARYFGGCPVLAAGGRAFPVEHLFLEDAYELTGCGAGLVTDQTQTQSPEVSWVRQGRPKLQAQLPFEGQVKMRFRINAVEPHACSLDRCLLAAWNGVHQYLERACGEAGSVARLHLSFLTGLTWHRQVPPGRRLARRAARGRPARAAEAAGEGSQPGPPEHGQGGTLTNKRTPGPSSPPALT